MTEYSLPYDYARCNGATEDEGVHLTCAGCLRRLAPTHPVRQAYFTNMSPDKEGKCVMFINSEKWKGM